MARGAGVPASGRRDVGAQPRLNEAALPATAAPSRENGSTRARILEAALDILVRDGPVRASMVDIARRAGLSRQGLYLHFDGKDDLTYQAARHAFEVAHADAQAILARRRPLTERLVGALMAEYASSRGGTGSRAARFWQGCEAPVIDRIIEMSNGFERAFVELLAGVLESDGAVSRPGDARGGDACVELATVLVAAARGLALSTRDISQKDHAELLRLAVARLCAPAH